MCRILVLAVTLLGALGAVLRCEEPVLPRVLTPGIMDLSVFVGGKARQLQFEFLPPAEPGTPDIGVLYESKEVWISTDFRRIVEGPSQYKMEYKPYPEFVGRADPRRGACLIESAKLVADAVEGDRAGDFVLTGTYRMMIQEGNEDPRWSGVRQFRIAGPQASMMGLFRWGHFGYRSRDWTTCIPSTDDPDFTTLFDGAKEGAKVGLSGGWGYVLAPVDFENHPDGPWPILSSLVAGWGAIGEVVYTHPIVRYERIHYTLDSARATVADALASESFSPRHRDASFFPARFGFDETEAFGSIVRYRFQIRPDSMTRLDWVEAFIPADPALPSDSRQMSWNVPAGVTESPLFTIDPFESGNPHRFPSTPGRYEVRLSFGELRVDANRDGQIKLASEDDSDATSAQKPFRFWLNDDDDGNVDSSVTGLYTEWEQDDQLVSGDSDKNCNDLVLNGTRDLEDFARLWIYTKGLNAAFKNGDMQLGLRWTDVSSGSPAIRLFKAADTDGGTGYLFNSSTASVQVDQTTATGAHGMAVGSVIGGTDPVILPQALFDELTEDQPKTLLLFEGVKAGKGQLKLLILDKAGTVVGEAPGVWMELSEPNELVERYTCGDTPLHVVGPLGRHPLSGALNAPATDEERDYVLYVHGYNMQEYEKQRWIETTFKRLYWLGFKGRVGGFTWPCSNSALPYDQSEERAWQAAARLREYLFNLQVRGYRVHVLGHSQGNVVVGEALRQWKDLGNSTPLVSSYIASQAAIEAHCFDASAPLIPGFAGSFSDNGTPNVYANYPPAGAPYMAIAAMSGTASRWVNFENPGDYALTGNSIDLSNPHPGWQVNQRLKPDMGFGYSASAGFYTLPPDSDRVPATLPADRFTIFSYIAEGRSLALGSTATAGVFAGNNTDLSTTLNYGVEHRFHSGQFRSYYAARYEYWRQLMLGIGLQPFTP